MSADVVALARRWVEELPADFVRRLADALESGASALEKLGSETVLPSSADAVRAALDALRAGHGPVLAGIVTGMLDADARAPTVTPVWTGPDSSTHSERLTLAVLIELLDSAREEIVLVSYATLPGRGVRESLAAAARRGVRVFVLLERTADNPRFSGLADPFPELEAVRLCWPASARPDGASMHAKLLIVDREVALVGSANLTDYGMERNLECGVLIRGGSVPRLLVEHLRGMDAIAKL